MSTQQDAWDGIINAIKSDNGLKNSAKRRKGSKGSKGSKKAKKSKGSKGSKGMKMGGSVVKNNSKGSKSHARKRRHH